MAQNVDNPAERTEDADLVLSLLGEYAPKLRTMCEEFVVIRSTRFRIAIIFFILPFAAFALAILWTTIPEKSSLPSLVVPVGGGLVLGMLTMAFVEIFVKLPRVRRLSWLEGDLRLLAAKVEKLVRTASQLNENLPLELGRRLEFEFRILEAEATLKYCESVLVGAPTKEQGEKVATQSSDASGTLPRITKTSSIVDH